MRTIAITIFIFVMTILSTPGQHHGHQNSANEHMHQSSVEELARRFEDPSRDIWQKPQQVIELMGEIKGKTIMDIGSGSGYFTFRLAEKGARVIAADVNDDFQKFIAAKKKELHIDNDQIILKKIPYDSPELKPESVDGVIIVNTYHHIDNRVPYFREVLDGLVTGGVLMVVDFKKQQYDQQVPGPPMEMRISQEQVKDELKQSGFSGFTIDSELLDYQYIIRAYK